MNILTPNAPLLRDMMSSIYRSPETHEQETWRCRTGMCAAGHALTEAGLDNWVAPVPAPDAPDGAQIFFNSFADGLIPLPGEEDQTYEREGVRFVTAGNRARMVLGLTVEQANDLFDQFNTVEDLERIVEQLIDGTWEDRNDDWEEEDDEGDDDGEEED